MPGSPSVTVLALANTGRRYEDAAVAGVSHFLEHMVFKGTAKYPQPQNLAEAIDAVGGEFNAFTSKEYTGYYVKLASNQAELALDVVSDMLLTPQLRPDDIAREAKVIVEEINMYEDMPMRRIHDAFDSLMYAGSNLAGEVLGSKETVLGMRQEHFQQHLYDWYGPANVLWVLAGDGEVLKDPAWKAKVEQLAAKGGADRVARSPQEFLSENPYGKERLSVITKQTEQAHFVLGWPAYKHTDPRRYAQRILHILVGGNMSSRLFSEIREKRGLCYYVRGQLDRYHDAGYFGAAAGVDPNRVNEAVVAARGEFLALLQDRPPTQAEVDKAKQYALGQFRLSQEDSHSMALGFGEDVLLTGNLQTAAEYEAAIQAVTLDEVRAVATDLIKPDQMRLALIGNFQKEQFKDILQ